MFNYRLKAMLKRELKANLFSKTFLIMTILMPVIMFAGYGMMFVLMTNKEDRTFRVEVVTPNDSIRIAVEDEYTRAEIKNLQASIKTLDGPIDDYVAQFRSAILDSELDGILYLPDSVLANKEVFYYSKNPNNNVTRSMFRSLINPVLLNAYFKQNPLTDDQIKYVQKSTSVRGMEVSKEVTGKETGLGKIIVAFMFTFFLYLSVIMIGMSALRASIEEKANRIVEILLSSVKASELMTAKVIASTTVGLVQIFIWTLPVIILSAIGAGTINENVQINITFGQITYFLTNYVIGVLIYVSLYAMMGAIFDNEQDAQQGASPIMFFIILPFFASIAMFSNPGVAWVEYVSMIPVISIITMPTRMALIDVPMWQTAFQLLSNLVILYFIIRFSSKVYRITILMTGKKPKWKDILRWAKTA